MGRSHIRTCGEEEEYNFKWDMAGNVCVVKKLKKGEALQMCVQDSKLISTFESPF